MKTALALSLLFFTSSALAAVIGRDVTYQAGDTVMKGHLVYDDAVEGKRAGTRNNNRIPTAAMRPCCARRQSGVNSRLHPHARPP